MPTESVDLFDGRRPPGEVLRYFLDERGWSQEQLAEITGRSRQTIIQIMGGKAGITPETAAVFAAAFGHSASDWLRLETSHRLSQIHTETADVARRARIHGLVPVRDIQRRGWIPETDDLEDLESAVSEFLGVRSLDDPPTITVAARKPDGDRSLTPAQLAWCARARQLATLKLVDPFDPARLDNASKELRELAAYRNEARHLPKVLGKYGIRFVVIEPLPGAKIDGAAFWLDDKSPVIVVSARYDRIDAFWFTVMHEFFHIYHGDALSVDTDMIQPGAPPEAPDPAEERANERASALLVSTTQMKSFIRRVGPYYSKDRVVQFAHRAKIHPGIIVGQLQHSGEIGYSALRGLLVKVRDVVTETAITDGWGQTISPGLLTEVEGQE